MSDSGSVALSRTERFLLGEIDASDLPLTAFAVYQRGRLDQQGEIDDLQARFREVDARDASPEPRDVSSIDQPPFSTRARMHGEERSAVRAEAQEWLSRDFGRGIA